MKIKDRTKKYDVRLTQEEISALIAALHFTKIRTIETSWEPIDAQVLAVLKVYQEAIKLAHG